MADNTALIFKCLNSECGKPIKLTRPAKSGVYPVKCPHCGVQKNLNIKGLDAFEQATGAAAGSAPDNSKLEPKELKDDFITGEKYKITCPHCGKEGLGFQSQKPGPKSFPCPACKGVIKANVRDKTHVSSLGESMPLVKGKLTLLRKGWLNKDYPLNIGSYTVGRYDESDMADIAVKHDNTMSRKSVKIDVNHTPKGFIFKLSVLKATNPVIHNNVPLNEGESVYLNFGDTLVLGKTKFRFDSDK